MADANVIRDFFVALGFKTNDVEASKMQSTLLSTEAKAKLLNKALVGLAAGAVYSVAKTAKELDKLYYSSQRVGASASNIQAYGDAISQMGGDAESAVASLESVAQKIRNSPGYEDLIKGLGVVTRDQNGQMRDRVEVFKDLSQTLSTMPYYQANAYAQSLGIDEKTMMAMRDGSFLGNMEKYQKLRKDMGMTDELAESGKDFMVESRELGMTIKGVSEVLLMTLGKTLIPILKLVNTGVQGTIRWFSELDPAIKNVLTAGMKIAFLTLVFSAFLKSIMMLKAGVQLLWSFLPVLKALRLSFLLSPIGIILSLASALALLWNDYKTWKEGGKSLFDWSKWVEGIDYVKGVLGGVLNKVTEFKDKVISTFKELDPSVQDLVKNILKFGALGWVFSKFSQGITLIRKSGISFKIVLSLMTRLRGLLSGVGRGVVRFGRMLLRVFAGLARAGGFILRFGGILKWLLKLFKFTPIGRAIALIGLLISAINFLIKDYEKWKNGSGSLFDWSKWTDGIDKIIGKIKDFLGIIDKIKDKVINFVKKVIDDPAAAIEEVAVVAKDALIEAADKAAEVIQDSDLIDKAKDVGGAVIEGGKQAVEWVGDKIDDLIGVDQIKPNTPYPTHTKQALPKTSGGLAEFAEAQDKPLISTAINNAVAQSVGLITSVAKASNDAVKGVVATTRESERIVKLLRVDGLNRVYQMADGSIETRGDGTTKNSGTVAWRNNNPGNLKFEFQGSADKTVKSKRSRSKALSDAKKRYEGVVDLDQWGNAIFETPEAGAVAKAKLLKNQHSDKTVAQMLRKYAVNDYSGKTNYSGYENTIYREGDRNGLDLRKKTIGQMSKEEFEALAQGMVIAEGVKKGVVTRSTGNNFTSMSNANLNLNNSIAPPFGNPEKSQINSSSSVSASNITIHQSFKTDMNIHGARDPIESANAVKHNQENSLIVMARNAKSLLA